MSKGIFFRGNLKEGNYTLIKTIDGWVLDGKDIVYAGFDIDDKSKINAELRIDFLKRQYHAALEENQRLKSDRPQGEWIIEYNGNGWNDCWDYICPNCGKKYERADAVLYKANFCPNCGAKMKGANDEN